MSLSDEKLLYRQKNEQNASGLRIYSMTLIYNENKSIGPTPSHAEHLYNVWHGGTGVVDWDILFPITQIRIKPALHNTYDTIMQESAHQYVMINCVECIWEI